VAEYSIQMRVQLQTVADRRESSAAVNSKMRRKIAKRPSRGKRWNDAININYQLNDVMHQCFHHSPDAAMQQSMSSSKPTFSSLSTYFDALMEGNRRRFEQVHE